MRIALVITELDPGGAEKCLTQLACYLKSQGHAVHVFALGVSPSSPHDLLVRSLADASVSVDFANAKNALSFLSVARWLRSKLVDFQPDVVQSMLWHANVATAWASRGKSWVLLGGARVSEPRKWRWPVEKWASRRMHRMVCVSDDVARFCQARIGIEHSKLLVIPNGVELRESNSRGDLWSSVGIAGAQRIALFVGRLESQKGVLDLVARADSLLAHDPDWSLVIVGRGSLEDRVRAIIQKSEHARRIHLAGWRADARDLIGAADLLLLPAAYEGMPNVLLEGMAEARSFVAFGVDGVEQLLANVQPNEARASQMARPGDWDDFLEKARALFRDESWRRECGQANRETVRMHFSLDSQLHRYGELYETLLKSKEKLGT